MNKASPIEGFAAPAFVTKARAEFDALRKAHPDMKYIDSVLADVIGVLRGKRMPVAEAAKLFDIGMQIPHSIYLLDANGEMTNPLDRGYGDGDPDGTAWPIPRTISRVWGEGPSRGLILMTLRDANGVADPAEPRAVWEWGGERFAAL